jgi:putative nucleotidyltransferase with HDIG domain
MGDRPRPVIVMQNLLSSAREWLTPIRLYVGVIAPIGVAVVVHSALQLTSVPHPVQWSVFAVLAVAAGRFLLKFPGIDAHLTMSDTFYMTSAALFGPAPATVAISADSLLTAWQRGWRPRQMLFNSASPALALWLGAVLFTRLTGAGPLYGNAVSVEAVVWALACFATVYFILNSGMTVAAMAIEKQISLISVWRRHLPVILMNFFGGASAAFCLLMVVRYLDMIALAGVMPLFGVLYLAMRSSTGRLQDAERHIATVDRLYLSTIGALSTAIEAKDGVTSSHIHRVQHYAMGLAKALGGLDDQTLKAIQAAALLHDTGKLAVPERILNKPGKLTPAEFETMKRHVDVGANILSSIDFPYPVVPIVRAHHENWDGTGYPNGLKGTDIPIGARILSVVDCYDALTSDRPYRRAMSDEDALTIIRERRGTMYEPAVVDMFERVCRDIAPFVVKPQMLDAIQQINRAAIVAPEPVPQPAAPVDAPGSLRALANLARIVSGRPTATDVASMIWAHVRHVVPDTSCAFFLPEPDRDAVAVRFAAGVASTALQGLEIPVGDRLTGWVAGHRQPIINSEAQLDLGGEAAFVGVRFCMALPLVHEGQVAGVLSLYGSTAFSEEQAQTLQSVLPHLAVMFLSLDRRADMPAAVPSRSSLRVVARR